MKHTSHSTVTWAHAASRLAIAATALVLCAVPAAAQFSGSLTGSVTDASGGVIPQATATIINEGTHQRVTKTTGADGTFTFPSLPSGIYDLSVSASSFKVGSYTAISVLQEPRNVNVTLTPGAVSDTVTVSASDTVALQTGDANVSATLDSSQLEKVPLYGRDPFNAVRTTPGITGDGSRSASGSANFLPNSVGPGGSNFGVDATENTVQISADGQRITDNNFLVDGVSVNSLGYGGATVINPNIEAIGSIQVIATSFSAEDGRNTGAQVKITTKSGTNQVHGTAFFQYDEPGLNAYNKYGGPPSAGGTPIRVSTKGRDFAASLGGPIIRDKFFGFGSFEETNQVLVSFPNAFVETPQFRAAIHAQRPGSIADQITNAAGGIPNIRRVLNQSCTSPVNQNPGYDPTQPVSATNVPLCQVVPGGLDIGSPLPLTANGGSGYASFNVNNQIQFGAGLDGVPDIQYVQLNASQPSVGRQFNGRLDYYLTPRDQFAASAYVTKLYRTTPSDTARPNSAVPFDPTNLLGTFIYIHTFSPSLLNEFRANYTRFSENGITDDTNAGLNLGIPYIELQNSNYTQNNRIHFGAVAAPTSPGIFAENQYEARDTVTKVFGSHTLKIGVEARAEQDNNNLLGSTRPTYTFAGIWNYFNDRPIYEGVQANPATGGAPLVNRYLDDQYFAGFVQHDWKVSKALTLNMGLRYEYFGPIYNKGLDINYPSLGTATGQALLGAALLPRHYLWNPNTKDFGPKFGFAFAPDRFNQKTVIRGGFSLAYNRLDNVLFDPALEDGPGVFSYGICCGTAPQDFGSPFVGGQIQYTLGASTAYNSYPTNPALKTTIGANGLPTSGIAIEAYGALPHLPQPYSYLYSLDVQNDLGHQLILDIGYQGSTGRHYSRLVNQNFVQPGATSANNHFANGLYLAQDDSNTYYNALNVTMSKNYKTGLSFQGTYSYSKAQDQVSSGDGADGNANQTNPQNNATELGPSDFDVRHRLVASGTYSVNYYHGGNYLEKIALNGWQVNGIFTAHTGFPFTPASYAVNGIPLTPTSQTIGPVRPYGYTGNENPGCGTNSAFENGTAFNGTFQVTTPTGATYRPGIGRNSFRGPCYQDIDVGVAKEIPLHIIGERGLFRFQAQAFNVNNKLNLAPFTFNTGPSQLNGALTATGQLYTGNNIPTGSRNGATNFAVPLAASAGRVIEFNARVQF